MKIYLLQDIENVGLKGEIIKVKEGYAVNFLIPRKLAVQITAANEAYYSQKIKNVEHREEIISSKTSMLAERLKSISLIIKRKMHDDGKLYGAISAHEVVDLLEKEGVIVAKSQIFFNKSIKEKGVFEVGIKLTTKIQSHIKIKVIAEVAL